MLDFLQWWHLKDIDEKNQGYSYGFKKIERSGQNKHTRTLRLIDSTDKGAVKETKEHIY